MVILRYSNPVSLTYRISFLTKNPFNCIFGYLTTEQTKNSNSTEKHFEHYLTLAYIYQHLSVKELYTFLTIDVCLNCV